MCIIIDKLLTKKSIKIKEFNLINDYPKETLENERETLCIKTIKNIINY